MCGIVGVHNLNHQPPPTETQLRQMLAMIRHRGPDQFGIYLNDRVGLGNARLSIIDLSGGQQPISNEDDSMWIVFNGEIFNYVELRPQLESLGHTFKTNSDTEVILHLHEQYGPDCLQYLNGQFAFAIWNSRDQSLFLARDRVGIRPLFYTVNNNRLIFGSEIKAILAAPGVTAAIDPHALGQVFTYWSTISPGTVFTDIVDVPPAHYVLVKDGNVTVNRYWSLNFTGLTASAGLDSHREQQYIEELRELLIDATRLRLRADVPVGAYLSGGLDSSLTTAIIKNHTDNWLKTFSIQFEDVQFDESAHQQQMARALDTENNITHITQDDIGHIFPRIVWHTETPILRTSPAPMYMLSQLVRQHNFKVVMTGEGADEFFGGYNIFKEALVRRFWARNPNSQLRPMLLRRMYAYIPGMADQNIGFLEGFFKRGLSDTDLPYYSHDVRWNNTIRTHRFFSPELREAIQADSVNGSGNITSHGAIDYPPDFAHWHPLEQAQYLEITIFMSQYLLSSQGDRMGMANSVEGRYPFLDHRVIEFAGKLPPRLKLFGLTEKYLLKKLGKQWLPDEIWKRPKHPYRAPVHTSFFNDRPPDYVRELLSDEQLRASGFFNPAAVAQMRKKINRGLPLGETDEMAVAGIISTQLLYQQFVYDFDMPEPLSDHDDVIVYNDHQPESEK